MTSSNRKITFVSLFHLLFVSVAAIVVLGWIVKLKGGDPLGLLQALMKGLLSKEAFGRTLDMSGSIMIAACGCMVAAHGRLWNIAAEGQCLVGFACACMALKAFDGNIFTAPIALLIAIFCGGLSGLVSLPANKDSEHPEVASGLIFNVVVALMLAGFHPTVSPLLFPLLQGSNAPRAGLLLALFTFISYRYFSRNLAVGLALRALPKREGLNYTALLAGALCGLAGGVYALSGHGSLGTSWGPEGLGYLAFAISFLALGNLWFSLPFLALFVGAISSGWLPDERAGLTTTALAICLISVATFLELRSREEAA